MSKRHIPESHTAHPNVTPLIDIIMCLIIFFMLVAKIGVTTVPEKIEIPTTLLGVKIQDMGNTLTLNIPREADQENPYVTALKPGKDGAPDEVVAVPIHDKDSGTNVLLQTLQAFHKQNPDFKVIIRAKADLQWRFIAPVLDTCREAGVRSINFNTKEGESVVAAPAAAG